MRFFFSLLFLCQGALAVTTPVAQEARRILQHTKSTHYTHDAVVDERKGRYDFDCSSFAKYVLDRANREAGRELDDIKAGARPLARDFVHLFQALQKEGDTKAWRGLNHGGYLRTGDLIAWLIPSTSTSKDTGHVMIVVGSPHKGDRPNEWLVPVIDAAESGHGKADPRRKAGPNGVGTGVVGIAVDSKDRPIGFYWSGGESTTLKKTTVVFGRPR